MGQAYFAPHHEVIGKYAWKFGAAPVTGPLDKDEFFIAVPKDEDGLVSEEDLDLTRFVEARNGDNLVTAFQCNTCHFRKLMGRDPDPSLAQGLTILQYIRS